MDLYQEWLNIPPGERPPDYYTLLGIERFEPQADAIRGAARNRMKRVRPLTLKFPAEATRLLNEIATAQVCLLDGEQKSMYDLHLQERQPIAPVVPQPSEVVSEPAPVATTEVVPEWVDPDPEVFAQGDPGLNGLLARAIDLAERGDFDAAYNTLDLAQSMRPGRYEQCHVRARVHLLNQSPTYALKENEQALKYATTPAICFLHGECLLALDRVAEAIDLIDEGLQQQSCSRGRYLLAKCCERQGRLRRAINECEVAWQLATLVERDRGASEMIAEELRRIRESAH